MVTQNSVALLLVFYESEQYLNNLFFSLKCQSFKNYKIYAIENSTAQSSIAKLSDSFHDAVVFPYQGNIGFAGANNLLAKKAVVDGCQYLFILNPDMELTENTISEFYSLLENNKNAAACSGVILFGNEKKGQDIIQLFGQKINFLNQHKEFLFAQKKLFDVELPDTLPVDFVNGGSLFIRSKIVEKIGLFNEDYFMYNDEIDLAYRIKKLEKSVLVTSKTKIYHHHDWTASNRKGYYLMYYYMMRNRILFFKNHKLFFSLILDLLKQLISIPVTINWLIKLAGFKLVGFYYSGLINGILGEKYKTKKEFV